MGTLAVSWIHCGPEDTATTLYCEKGIMKIYGDPLYQVVVSKRRGDAACCKVGQMQTNESQSNSGVIDAFISSSINRTPPPVTGEDGLKGLQVVFAAIESSRKESRNTSLLLSSTPRKTCSIGIEFRCTPCSCA